MTSHVTVAFTLSFSLFIGICFIAARMYGFSYFFFFVPSGAPIYLIPFLVIIEIISFLSRPFSLGIRLFANMMSGHALLAILTGFVFIIVGQLLIVSIFPSILIIAIIALETMIAVLQAYVFTVLICIYLNDAIQSPHAH